MGITINFPHDPVVRFTPDAWADMFYITNKVKTEVGMLGTITQVQEYEFLVDKIYLPQQEVNGATTEMQPEHVGLFIEWLMDQPGGDEARERLGMWAHSHASMGLTASHQDQKMLEALVAMSRRVIVAVRTNHKGESTADILYPNGLQLNDVPCEEDVDTARLSADWDALITTNVQQLMPKVKTQESAGKRKAAKEDDALANELLYGDYYGHDWPDWPSRNQAKAGYGQWLEEIGFIDLEEVDDVATWYDVESQLHSAWKSGGASIMKGEAATLQSICPEMFHGTMEGASK